jgi:hypothetical protein
VLRLMTAFPAIRVLLPSTRRPDRARREVSRVSTTVRTTAGEYDRSCYLVYHGR